MACDSRGQPALCLGTLTCCAPADTTNFKEESVLAVKGTVCICV